MPHHDTGETSRPVVYLDVDGVLNAIGGHHAFGDSTGAVVEGFTLTLSPALGGRLNRWNAEIRWLTTWGHRANAVGRLIGLPHRAVAAVPPAGADAAGTWKLDAVRHEIERTPRPFVWIDDTAPALSA